MSKLFVEKKKGHPGEPAGQVARHTFTPHRGVCDNRWSCAAHAPNRIAHVAATESKKRRSL